MAEWPAVTKPAKRFRRVLVVEDYLDSAQTLAMLVNLLGHEVRVAHSGTEGVRVALEWTPDAVLCDIGLPGLDGYGVARQLRSHVSTESTVLIALTGYGTEEDIQRSRLAGFNYHITKPADPTALLSLLWADDLSFTDVRLHPALCEDIERGCSLGPLGRNRRRALPAEQQPADVQYLGPVRGLILLDPAITKGVRVSCRYSSFNSVPRLRSMVNSICTPFLAPCRERLT